MGLNFHEEAKTIQVGRDQLNTARSQRKIKFPACPTTPNLRQKRRGRKLITETSSEEEEKQESEESYFEIEDTPELDHPARNTGRTSEIDMVNNHNNSARSWNSFSSNTSWNGLKYTDKTDPDVVKNALIADGIRQRGMSKEISKIDQTMVLAQKDPAIMKGLIQYLNWQDGQ